MGIRGLIRHMRPFAHSAPLCDQEVVIDGPGFAHHIYHLCLGARRTANNALEAAPSYGELVAAAITWLEALTANGVSIRKIYFDGQLPMSKYDIRAERISTYTQQLQTFHHTFKRPYRISSQNQGNILDNFFTHQNVPDKLTKLPASAFLVPAILESLVTSKDYQQITEVVPGEADIYCAHSLKTHGGIVLTGDSDLLVYDLGENGSVVFFRDMEWNSTTSLTSIIYQPMAVGLQVGLVGTQGLRPLAFQLSLSPYSSLADLRAKAKALESVEDFPGDYMDFLREYSSDLIVLKDTQQDTSVLQVLRSLDPRVSEYVIQFPTLASIAGRARESGILDSSPHIYLPFLIDCPVRTNAWEISMTVRQLAYGLINLIVPENEQRYTAFEHKRQQGKSRGRELQLPSPTQIPTSCNSLITLLNELAKKFTTIASSDLWIAVAVCQDIDWAHQNSKTSATELALSQLSTFTRSKGPNKELSWDVLQLLAQIQGSFQSFRMLKQMMNLVVAYNANGLPKEAEQLQSELQSLPLLSELEGLGQAIPLLRRIEKTGMFGASQEVLGIAIPSLPLQTSALRKVKKQKRKRQVEGQSGSDLKRSSNLFALLDAE
ncbi:XPG domain containing-domain-containing protein [Tricladium varicosporioides]|nr:XPG domain containing-domain-containing protein [Hymenoscyphus varicosporioides]